MTQINYYKIYKHRHLPKLLAFPLYSEGNKSTFSNRRLKRQLKHIRCKWNVMLTLTYNDENVKSACSNHIRKLINNIRQYNRNKLKYYNKPRYHKIRQYYEFRNSQFKYVWKIEFDSSGNRKWNPHFHVLIESPFYLSKSKIESYWNKGYVTLRPIKNREIAKKYVSKYITKKTYVIKWSGKTYSKSRNIPTKNLRMWDYYGCLDYKDWYKLKKISYDNILLTPKGQELMRQARENYQIGRVY
ncbi:MAG: hypothetical protein P8Y97_21260 [Candidatus Lokiarchaeota archaeon]